MAQSNEPQPYWLFNPIPMDADMERRLMGLVVVSPKDPIGPTAYYGPLTVTAADCIDKLYTQAVCSNVERIERGAKDRTCKAMFNKAVSIWHTKAKDRDSTLTVPRFRRLGMVNGARTIEDLLRYQSTENESSNGDDDGADMAAPTDKSLWYRFVQALKWLLALLFMLLGLGDKKAASRRAYR